MPRLVIDGQTVEVAPGTKVIQAAEDLGIYIPRFCFHEALGSVGACRMCAVMFLEGPVKGLDMSCMVKAADGMVVSTDHPEARRFRSQVIEWLMLNHPHDCPVCDEGGNCLLQDLTVAGGHGVRRYDGLKRTFRDQDLGPFLAHEMNRCIHCWRCRRFYQEYAGYFDLGAMQIGTHTYFGRQKSGAPHSPFAGNLVDICPTGVYTDKPSRFQGRYWDFSRAHSICPHCSLGCATTVNVRYRQVVRLEARKESAVNGHFICDRGRYGYGYANHPQRPRQARVDGREVDVRQGLQAAADRLREIVAEHGTGAVAGLGSCRLSLEGQTALERLCLAQGWPSAHFFLEPDLALRVQEAARGLAPDLAVSLAELEKADLILLVGAAPMSEAPMAALALRQAQRRGAQVAVLDPRPQRLPFSTNHLPLACNLLEVGLAWLVEQRFRARKRSQLRELHPRLLAAASLPGLAKKEQRELKKMARALAKSKRPVIVCGTDMVPQDLPARASGLARLLREEGQDCGLFFILPGANALGAVLVAPEEPRTEDLLETVEQGEIRALVLVESAPLAACPDRARLERALQGLDLLVALDHLPSLEAEMARVFLPTANLFEGAGSSLVNQEGRLQWAQGTGQKGIPLSQVADGGHPPRVYSLEAPGGDLRPAAELLEELARLLAEDGDSAPAQSCWDWLAGRQPSLTEEAGRAAPPYGRRVLPMVTCEGGLSGDAVPALPGPDELELLVCRPTLWGDELSAHTPLLTEVAEKAALWLNNGTAEEMGLTQGMRVVIEGAGGLELPLAVFADLNPQTAVLLGGPDAAWQRLRGRRTVLPRSAVRPAREA